MFQPLSLVKGRTGLAARFFCCLVAFQKTTCNWGVSAGRAEHCQTSEQTAHLLCSCREGLCLHT